MRLFSLRPATAIRAATACALAFIVIVYTSLSALFSLLVAVLRSALRALAVLISVALLTVFRSTFRTLAVLISAALLAAVLRSSRRTVSVLPVSAALLTAVLRSARRALAVLISAALLTAVLRSALRAITVLSSVALLTAVLQSALRALSVRTSFRLAARSTVVSAIFTVDIRTVTHSHGPALVSDGHGVVLILLQIRGAMLMCHKVTHKN